MSDTALREAAERLMRNQRETFEYPPGAGYYDDTADLELVCGTVLREHSTDDSEVISEEWLRSALPVTQHELFKATDLQWSIFCIFCGIVIGMILGAVIGVQVERPRSYDRGFEIGRDEGFRMSQEGYRPHVERGVKLYFPPPPERVHR